MSGEYICLTKGSWPKMGNGLLLSIKPRTSYFKSMLDHLMHVAQKKIKPFNWSFPACPQRDGCSVWSGCFWSCSWRVAVALSWKGFLQHALISSALLHIDLLLFWMCASRARLPYLDRPTWSQARWVQAPLPLLGDKPLCCTTAAPEAMRWKQVSWRIRGRIQDLSIMII